MTFTFTSASFTNKLILASEFLSEIRELLSQSSIPECYRSFAHLQVDVEVMLETAFPCREDIEFHLILLKLVQGPNAGENQLLTRNKKLDIKPFTVTYDKGRQPFAAAGRVVTKPTWQELVASHKGGRGGGTDEEEARRM